MTSPFIIIIIIIIHHWPVNILTQFAARLDDRYSYGLAMDDIRRLQDLHGLADDWRWRWGEDGWCKGRTLSNPRQESWRFDLQHQKTVGLGQIFTYIHSGGINLWKCKEDGDMFLESFWFLTYPNNQTSMLIGSFPHSGRLNHSFLAEWWNGRSFFAFWANASMLCSPFRIFSP